MTCEIKMTRNDVGALKLVVVDLAGTTVDYGSMAPSGAFVDLFGRHGVDLSDAEARGPMGMHKRDHIAALLALPAVAKAWTTHTGRKPSDADRDALYQEFVPLQTAVLPRYGDVIPGTLTAMKAMRALGVRIGVTTGYAKAMMDIVLAGAAQQGFQPDVAVSGEEVPAGRPAPWMAQECARRLGIYPMAACLHIGDTKVDVLAGRHAGMWSAGVAATGNLMGLSLKEWQALDTVEREARLHRARQIFFETGAHAVIDSVAELPELVETIQAIMAKGGSPDIEMQTV